MKDLRILFREAAGDVFAVWRKEVRRVVHDQGALIFFILVPLFYPLLYALIYTGEVVREVPVVVVDDGETATSRCGNRCPVHACAASGSRVRRFRFTRAPLPIHACAASGLCVQTGHCILHLIFFQ